MSCKKLAVFGVAGNGVEGFGEGGVGFEEVLDGGGEGRHCEGGLKDAWTMELLICGAYHVAVEVRCRKRL